MPEDFESVLDAQVTGPTTKNLIKSDFPVESFKPKVQIAFQRLPGQCPRRIEVERYVSRKWLKTSWNGLSRLRC